MSGKVTCEEKKEHVNYPLLKEEACKSLD